MEPTLQVEEPIPPPTGSPLSRGLQAVLRERRVPYQVRIAWDRLASSLGMRYKTIKIEGLKIIVRRRTDDEVFVRTILVSAQYNPPGYEIGESDAVVNIGGNIGSFAMFAGRRARRGRVITIEPVAENFALLERNLAANRLSNVKAVRAAILDKPGEVRIDLNPDPIRTGTHSFQDFWVNDRSRTEVVHALSLPAIFDDLGIDQCDFLKLDCEGSEYPILFNLPEVYYRRIRKIVMEYHCSSLESKRAEADSLVAHLERFGYRIDSYTDFSGFRCGMIFASRT